ncbi:translation elongation factor 2 (EF-2/EF-G) [Nakamurella panacisegetis]|uniref:Translation elongation factor 2 (EF-2/EF-G) n=1 Tax=Nakamurella panacisegetis TaxID=1090615 RepID=A0A1H0NXH0_9ACTN|nr:elongation factor G-like protein EF-G2 [Nakamurella panacisegetis]SDO97472.1 translation elongation factor 2 (EF-2/EF-G) [Nakamurella panacisegetis]
MTTNGPIPVPSQTRADRVRNVALVGPSGGGKTTFAESVLYLTGELNRAGSVAEGTTALDHDDIEKRLGHSVSMTVASTTLADPSLLGRPDPVRVNLVDTPGHADFVGELRAGLRAADAALFVVSAVDGVDAPTRALWQECAAAGTPRAIVVTHIDQPRGDFASAVQECRESFGAGVQALYVPDGDTLVGLLSGTAYRLDADRRHRSRSETATVPAADRDALIEGIITESEDDTLLDRYLGGEVIEFDTLVADLEKAVARGAFHPVVPVVPTTGLGVPEALELIARAFPDPREHPIDLFSPAGATLGPIDFDGPLVAEVVKTTTDPYVGRVSLVRVYRGVLTPDSPVHVSGHLSAFSGLDRDEQRHPAHDLDERVGAVSRPVGANLQPVARAVEGDIVAVARLAHAETGDTLSDPTQPAVLPPWTIPEPLLPTAVTPRASGDEDKLMQALARLQAEDPTVRVEVDPDTEQMVIWTVGTAQLDVVLDRLRTRAGVEITTHPVLVPLRETIRSAADGLGRHVKQSGGHGQYAIVEVQVEPLAEGNGFEFVDRVVGGAVPRQYIPSVEKGVRQQLERGVTGHPMVDLRVTLVGGKAHSVDSSDAAFQLAGALALKNACSTAGVQVLEPVDSIEITVDDEFVGAVLADLSSRRGRVRGTAAVGAGRSQVQADVPAVELVRYAADLRSLARGSGQFRREYLRHAPAPDAVLDRLQAKS